MQLQPPSQLLLRHVDALGGRHVLIIDAPAGEVGPELADRLPETTITLLQTNYSDYRSAVSGSGSRPSDRVRVRFSAWYTEPGRAPDHVVLYLPKGKDLLEMMLAMIDGLVGPGAVIWLVGPIRGGIKSSKAALEDRFGPVTSCAAARHCVLYAVTAGKGSPAVPNLDDFAHTFSLEAAGQATSVVSFPGIFSHGRLDDGTRLLLESLETATTSQVLDFGC
jgi:16S rRNA (guanine1207-N2)-methyltransferase